MTFNDVLRAVISLSVLFLSIVCGPQAKASECYQSTIKSPTPFLGVNDEVFVLTDGSIWQVKYEYEYLYEYYPSVIICPSRGILIVKGKSLNVASLGTGQGRGRSLPPQATPNALTVVYRVKGCDYFVADGPAGLYVLEWQRGFDPAVGDEFAGYERGYGFKDVVFLRNGRESRVYVEDYLLTTERAAEILASKCS
ncbi:hypothetical protein [Aquidulcibacter paucihalophilus]|uniref:hypothetical protein n=1 Tax=Aquidulcibacter paucihalophilus TaxID=1978549 RepID=UPI0012FFC96F|nr:hypothetical protein [Aquidulcibacter paucihalophilus]